MMTSLTIIMTVVVFMVMISIMMITMRRFFFLIFSCFINQPIAVTIRSTEFGLELTRHKREAVLPILS